MEKPIFILASERSGTNLLRTLLSNHSNLEGPIATHLLHVFFKYKEKYGDLRDKVCQEKLFNHFKKSVNHIYTNWEIRIEFEEFYSKYQPKSFVETYNAFHKEKVGNGIRYVCKDKNIYDNVSDILEIFPDAKFIYLVRDPRDYVVSNLKNPRSLWTVYDNAKAWGSEQNRCLKYLSDSVTMIKYEDLVADTKNIMRKILNFIEEPIEEACFTTSKDKNKDVIWNKHWKNLDKPIMKSNYNNYDKFLSKREINIIESICKEQMDILGYELSSKADWKLPMFYHYRNRFNHLFSKLLRLKYVLKDQKLSNLKNALNRSLINELN